MDSVGASGDCNEIPSRQNSKKPAVEAPPKLQIREKNKRKLLFYFETYVNIGESELNTVAKRRQQWKDICKTHRVK